MMLSEERKSAPRRRMARLLMPDLERLETGHGFDELLPGEDLISVIVPSYEHEAYVEEALRSVARQSHRDVEIILIDDQSADRTFERALEALRAGALPYCAARRRHAGMDTNINIAILMAHGSWIAFLASDDAFPAGSLEMLLRAARASDADVAVGPVQEMTRQGIPAASRAAAVARYHGLSGDALRRALLEEHGSLMVQGMLFARRVFASVGVLAPETAASDFDLLIRMASRGVKFAFVDEVTALHRHTRDVLSRDHIQRSLGSHLQIARQRARSRSEYRRSASTFLCEAAANSFHYGHYADFLQASLRALALAPLKSGGYFFRRLAGRLYRRSRHAPPP